MRYLGYIPGHNSWMRARGRLPRARILYVGPPKWLLPPNHGVYAAETHGKDVLQPLNNRCTITGSRYD